MTRCLLALFGLISLVACQHTRERSASCISFEADGGIDEVAPQSIDGACWFFAASPIESLSLGGLSGDAYLVQAHSGQFAWVSWGQRVSSGGVIVAKPRHSADCLRGIVDGGATDCVLPGFRSLN